MYIPYRADLLAEVPDPEGATSAGPGEAVLDVHAGKVRGGPRVVRQVLVLFCLEVEQGCNFKIIIIKSLELAAIVVKL